MALNSDGYGSGLGAVWRSIVMVTVVGWGQYGA
jgi:hypothetical protein